ncbi:leucine-rich repeat-containing protein 74A-like isoform X1 [Leucoraja erinacea]|uniref:leucine-rich repeat-containing protein 74A-like isoform X1 n=1 Tax=Leucoraja erinaceus TaxID=7782 RepID=UPI002455EE69|nr:leucine-rich repeat-containing protein 74A-like isoform X1 [Leucoraja erinacea]
MSSLVYAVDSIESLCDEPMDRILERTSEDDFDTDVEIDVKSSGESQSEEQIYRKACEEVGVSPMSYFLRHYKDVRLNLNYRCISAKALKALSISLVTNTVVTILDLEYDGIDAEGVRYLMEMLAENCFIQTLNLSNNELRTEGADVLCQMLPLNISLKCIKLAGNKLIDGDAAFFDDVLSSNFRISELDLSYNEFGNKGAEFLGHMLANNESLEKLNLSWNQIQTQGAVAISAGLRMNITLKVLDLSCNGFGNEGALAMGETLKYNNTLLELNLSTNHINNEGVANLCKGMDVNDNVKFLYLNNNPITVQGAVRLLEVMQKNEKTNLETISIQNVLVNETFMDLLKPITANHPLFQIEIRGVGGLVSGGRTHRIDPMKVIQDYLDKRKLRLSDFFRNMDKLGTMTLPVSDFRKTLQQLKIPLDLIQVEELINKLDKENTGTIDYRKLVDTRKQMIHEQREQLRKEETRQRKEKQKAQRVLKTFRSAINAITPRSSTVISSSHFKLPDIHPLKSSSSQQLSSTPLSSWHHVVVSNSSRYSMPTLSNVQLHHQLSHSSKTPLVPGARLGSSPRIHSISQPKMVSNAHIHSQS